MASNGGCADLSSRLRDKEDPVLFAKKIGVRYPLAVAADDVKHAFTSAHAGQLVSRGFFSAGLRTSGTRYRV
jgi:hypothetical protein